MRAGDPRGEQPAAQPRRPRDPLRSEPAPRGPAAGDRPGIASHGRGAQTHLRCNARAQARRGDRRLRLYGRHLRRELRELRTGVERDSGGFRRARLPAHAESDHARDSYRYIASCKDLNLSTTLSAILRRLDLYEKLLRLDKPIGTLLLLWPTLWAL